MNDQWIREPKREGCTIAERKQFKVGPYDVEEFIVQDDNVRKVVWCLAPFEKLVVNGLKNFLVYDKYGKDCEHLTYESARKAVEKAFVEHWHIAL